MWNTLKRKIGIAKEKGDAKKVEALTKELKKARRRHTRDIAALVSTSVFTALIALAFKGLFHRIEDDEKDFVSILKSTGVDAFGNMLGGLPIVSDIYSFFMTGYGVEDLSMSAVNDLLESAGAIFDFAIDATNDTIDERSTARMIRNVLYSGCHVLGIPVRNIYNLAYSIIGFNGTVKYKWDDFFYKQSYSADLAKAIETEDEDMIATIFGIITGERVGSITDKKSLEVMHELAGAGLDVMPRAVGDTMTVDGVEYSLTGEQRSEFKTIYGDANEALADLVKLKAFARADKEVQAKAIKRVYDTYYQLAQVEALGTEDTKATLFARVIDVEELALVIAYANTIKADTDRSGKAISGSRRKKIERYVQSLGCTAAEKYMIMGYLGYKNTNGEAQVKSLIRRYRLPKAEQEKLMEYCGY